MFWQEDNANETYRVPEDVVDLSFRIRCRQLPVDHAFALSRSVSKTLPWLEEEAQAGMHLIHCAETGNGWSRPEDQGGDVLHLSRRTRFVLRVPQSRLDEAKALSGQTLAVDGNNVEVGDAKVKPLSALTTLFARHVVTQENEDEDDFSQRIVSELHAMNIKVRKLLCGRGHSLHTPDETIHTRSLMLADLAVEESVRLQENGLGPKRHMGCGLFVPHKDINAVGVASEES